LKIAYSAAESSSNVVECSYTTTSPGLSVLEGAQVLVPAASDRDLLVESGGESRLEPLIEGGPKDWLISYAGLRDR
jgi:hypothetical protein